MKYVAFIFSLFISMHAEARMIKVAVLDSGFDKKFASKVKLCSTGHFDFIKNEPGIGADELGHGSNVALTIGEGLEDVSYCILIFKIDDNWKGNPNLDDRAILRAIQLEADVINMSFNGAERSEQEASAVAAADFNGIKMFASAGNKGERVEDAPNPETEQVREDAVSKRRLVYLKKTGSFLRLDQCSSYPACLGRSYRNLLVVSSWQGGNINRGSLVRVWKDYCSSNEAATLCGTSQSAALATHDYVRELWNKLRN